MSHITEDDDAIFQEWGEKRLLACLRFLELDNTSKLSYLPSSFSEITFHMDEGDLLTGNPLKFLCALTEDVCRFTPIDSESVHQLLRELRALLDVMNWSENVPIWDLSWCISQRRLGTQWAFIWDLVARLAGEILRVLGWSAALPDLPCETLLAEYSYGAYVPSALPEEA